MEEQKETNSEKNFEDMFSDMGNYMVNKLRDIEPLLTSIINKKSHFKPAEIEEAIRIKGKIKGVLEK